MKRVRPLDEKEADESIVRRQRAGSEVVCLEGRELNLHPLSTSSRRIGDASDGLRT